MSRADIQTMTIMAVATGAMVTMEENNIAGDVLPSVLYARQVADDCLNRWPETGDPRKNTIACIAHCRNLADPLFRASELYAPLCLTSLAQLLLTDLAERLTDSRKHELLDPVMEAIDGIHDQVDPDGDQFTVYEHAEKLAVLVKKEIGF